MKKALSVLLSLVMLATITAGIDLSAYASGPDFSSASEISFGQTVSKDVVNQISDDCYKITLSQSGIVTFNYNCTSLETDIKCGISVFIYDSTGKECIGGIGGGTLENGKCSFSSNVNLIAGTYCFCIPTYTSYVAKYSFSIGFVSSNESFAESLTHNDSDCSRANPIKLNTTYNGMISKLDSLNDEYDYYKLTIPSKTTITLDLTGTVLSNSVSQKSGTLFYRFLKIDASAKDGYTYYETGSLNNAIASSVTAQLHKAYTLEAGNYYFCVNSFDDYNYSFKISASAISIKKPKSTSIKKLTKGKKQFKVTYKKISGVTGYQISYSTSKKFAKKNTKTITVKGAKNNSKTIKKLKAKKKYYVKVRAYKTVNGKKYYGSWSKTKSVKSK